MILQATPTTSKERLKKIVEAATGFIYLVSLEGVTGSKLTNPNTTFKLIKEVKAQTHPPVMVGFGISKGEHAKAIIDAGADGVVVGSRRRSGWKRLRKNIRQKLTKPHCNTT